ncbi:MAG: type IV conjugative transfer system protein TraE [Nitrospinota bacterium]|nr:type IV conjugative transfer system protein TraE [Nitrospinota bacterium]
MSWLNVFLQKESNLFAENRLLKFSVAVMTTALVLAIYFATDAARHQIVVLVPPSGPSMEVSGDTASEIYLKQIVRYASSLALTYSPITAESQFEELLAMYHPSYFEEGKTNFLNMLEVIKGSDVNTVFYITKMEVEKTRVILSGRKLQTAKGISILDAEKTYYLSYVIESGRFWITGFEEKVESVNG